MLKFDETYTIGDKLFEIGFGTLVIVTALALSPLFIYLNWREKRNDDRESEIRE